jgi:hypothetical protein
MFQTSHNAMSHLNVVLCHTFFQNVSSISAVPTKEGYIQLMLLVDLQNEKLGCLQRLIF